MSIFDGLFPPLPKLGPTPDQFAELRKLQDETYLQGEKMGYAKAISDLLAIMKAHGAGDLGLHGKLMAFLEMAFSQNWMDERVKR